MKRFVLLSVATMMLASAVFAPVAMAQVPGEVNVQSVELGPGGSVIVTATVECVQDQFYEANVTVRQKTGGNILLGAGDAEFGTCPSTGPLTFSFTTFGQIGGGGPEGNGPEKPFHKGKAVVSTFGIICATEFNNCLPEQTSVEQIRIT